MPDWGPFTQRDPPDPVRWTMHNEGGRIAQCRIDKHPLGFELRVDIDGEPRLTQVHRQEVDADLHAATLEDQFIEKGWKLTKRNGF